MSNSTEKSPSLKADSRSANQEILHLVWNREFQSHVHKSLQLDPVLSQMYPVHLLTPHFFKIC
jgi:hypothetical protein